MGMGTAGIKYVETLGLSKNGPGAVRSFILTISSRGQNLVWYSHMGATSSTQTETAVLGGGCFCCLEATFQMVAGVTNVVPGYAGGHTKDPDYWSVASKKSGHAEVVRVEFDPAIISYADILDIFWALHDPTTKDRQGHDVGPEYRSIILYGSPEQQRRAEISRDQAQAHWQNPIVTEIKPLDAFYEAEEEHHNFFKKHPEMAYCQIVINPKIAKLRATFAYRLKAGEAP
jgi:peptide-methionine (S)-S-oxide reductase